MVRFAVVRNEPISTPASSRSARRQYHGVGTSETTPTRIAARPPRGALLPAPLRGRRAELALEGAVEGRLGLVAEPLGDLREPRAGRAKLACGEREAPFRQVLDRRLSDVVREALGQDRARAADLARELADRPVARGVAMQELQAFAHIGVA